MKNQLTLIALALVVSVLPVMSIEGHPSPDTPALSQSWTSPEPTANHVHSNGKDIISFIPFATCIDAGLENAKQACKPLLVYVKKPGCPHCLSFESGVLRQPKLKQYIEQNFSCARVLHGSVDDQVLKANFGCNSYPHFVVFSKDGKLLGKWFGLPKSAKGFEDAASAILANSK